MNWKHGIFRVWLVASILWIAGIAAYSYSLYSDNKHYPKYIYYNSHSNDFYTDLNPPFRPNAYTDLTNSNKLLIYKGLGFNIPISLFDEILLLSDNRPSINIINFTGIALGIYGDESKIDDDELIQIYKSAYFSHVISYFSYYIAMAFIPPISLFFLWLLGLWVFRGFKT